MDVFTATMDPILTFAFDEPGVNLAAKQCDPYLRLWRPS